MARASGKSPKTKLLVADQKTRPSLLLRVRMWDDPIAWEAFEKWCRPLILRVCRRRGLDWSEAEDVVQIVLVRLAKRMGNFTYDVSGSFRGWLTTLVESTIWNVWERRSRVATVGLLVEEGIADPASLEQDGARRCADTDASAACQPLQKPAERVLAAVRGRFKESSWSAFWMVEIEGMSTGDAAQRLGMTEGAVRAARARVLAQLREEGCKATASQESGS